MIVESTFKPAWWLSNAHAQTIYPTLARRSPPLIDKKERFELPDGDFIDVLWAERGVDKDAPLIIFLHGLGGNIESAYVSGQFQAYKHHGWRAAFMYFRGASEEPNRLARAYHSGDTGDLDFILQQLKQREPHTQKALVGVSLGGNVLLKWLGEHPLQTVVNVAVAVSVPLQLRVAANRISQGFSKFYQHYLLNRMREMFKRKLTRIPHQLNEYWNDAQFAHDFWTFDDKITAPLHGFSSVHDYYRLASSRQFLNVITTPTLIIHSLDDPFMSPDVIPNEHELSASVTFELSQKGGHVGFISGHVPGVPTYWLDQRIPLFLKDHFTSNLA